MTAKPGLSIASIVGPAPHELATALKSWHRCPHFHRALSSKHWQQGSGQGIVCMFQEDSAQLWHCVVQMGAMMNEAFQAKEGLPPDLFPGSVPTYTGHYHKPHVVENTNIRYIGSPYQGCDQSVKSSFNAHKLTAFDVSCLVVGPAITQVLHDPMMGIENSCQSQSCETMQPACRP